MDQTGDNDFFDSVWKQEIGARDLNRARHKDVVAALIHGERKKEQKEVECGVV